MRDAIWYCVTFYLNRWCWVQDNPPLIVLVLARYWHHRILCRQPRRATEQTVLLTDFRPHALRMTRLCCSIVLRLSATLAHQFLRSQINADLPGDCQLCLLPENALRLLRYFSENWSFLGDDWTYTYLHFIADKTTSFYKYFTNNNVPKPIELFKLYLSFIC